jgi:hypothetical protein
METATADPGVDLENPAGEHVPDPADLGDDPGTGKGEGEEPDAEAPPAADPDAGTPPAEPELIGSGQLSLSVGGKQPTSSSFRMVGGAMPIEGSFKKGETVTLMVECQVREVAFKDTVDDSGSVTATERRHKATVIGVSR